MSLTIESITNSVIRGDTFDVLPLFPDHCIDLIIADMPYNITDCKWESNINLERLWQLYNHIIKPDGVICLFGSGLFTAHLMISNETAFRYKWIWKKFKSPNFMQATKRPLNNYEEIVVFFTGSNTIYNPIMKERICKRVEQAHETNYSYIRDKSYETSFKASHKESVNDFMNYDPNWKYPELIIDDIHPVVSTSHEKVDHPTQKPEALYEYFINTYTHPNMLILDTFSGSGTNAIACLKTKRNFVCIEKNQDNQGNSLNYIKIILERIKKQNTSNSFKKTSYPLYNIYQLQSYFDKFK